MQATYLGFIGPVPLPELDFLLCDDFVVPPALAGAVSAAAAARSRATTRRTTASGRSGRAMTRAAAGLPDDAFRVLLLLQPLQDHRGRCSPPGWRSCAARRTRCCGWPTDNEWSPPELARPRAERWASTPARLIFADARRSRAATWRGWRWRDLFLDTFPYNAGTVASDAIRMGLPLLTLAGQSFASRMAARLLNAIGAEAGIAASHEEYVAKAVMLATDAATHAAYKACFTPDGWAATIGDSEGFTRRFEQALESVHRQPAAALQEEAAAI